jgi:ABC-type polar amino acid transport system ATPase subunit
MGFARNVADNVWFFEAGKILVQAPVEQFW